MCSKFRQKVKTCYMFCFIKTCNMFQNLVKYFDFSKKISKQLAIHHHKSYCLGQDLQNELSCVASFDKKLKPVTCFHHCPSLGGHENFFGTRDLRQSILRIKLGVIRSFLEKIFLTITP